MMATVDIERVKKFWDARPCNIRHSAHPVGSMAWSLEVSRRKYFVEPHIPRFAQFECWYGKCVLEVGCGIGTDTLEFCRARARVWAVDLSPATVLVAQQRVNQVHGYHAWIHCLDAEETLPFIEDGFDLVYAFGVLHHTPHPERVLDRAYRVLRPGGELRVMLYARRSLKNLLGERPEAQAGCPLARVYTKKSACALLENSGFLVSSVERAHIFPWRVKDYVNYRYVKRWPFRLLPKEIFSWLERQLGWHLLLTARRP